MKTSSDLFLRRDLLKLLCVTAMSGGAVAIFLATPGLSTPTLISIVATMLFSPLVLVLERRGYPRVLAIFILFGTVGLAIVAASFWAVHTGETEWVSLKQKSPEYFWALVDRLRDFETKMHEQLPFLNNVHLTESIVKWLKGTGDWFVEHGPKLVGDLLGCLFISPILTFFLLSDGRAIRQRFFDLVPNRYFESAYIVTHEIGTALSDYLRAKLLEAFLVGAMTTIGLLLVNAPFATVLGIIAGITNIIPYAGPVLGAIPGLVLIGVDSSQLPHLWPMILVYVFANLVDMLLIFPVIVAKLVDLHPLLLIAAVAIGQHYSGLVGMLISIPIATAFKVVLQQIYRGVYEHRAKVRTPENPLLNLPLIQSEKY